MGKRKTKDKSSMRNTPQNKINRINADLILCENALFRLESGLCIEDMGEEAETRLNKRISGLKAHMEGLKTARLAWQKGGPRARR